VKRTQFLWITDPWATLDAPRDTSLRLAQEAEKRGHESWWCDVKSVRCEGEKIRFEAQRLSADDFSRGSEKTFSIDAFDSIHYRVDPPVDLAYSQPLQILRLALEQLRPGKRPEFVNPIQALLTANEKLEAVLIPKLSAPGITSSQWEALARFGHREKRTVMKPLFTAQSQGIELLDWSDAAGARRARRLLEGATDGFQRPVLLQRYLKGIARGETRLWFLDGQVLATAKKLPLKNDFRVNIDQGSQLAAHQLTTPEKRAATAIGKRLRALKVRLAAIDLIDGYVTDFNFTSPGLIKQMEEITGKNLALQIINALTRSRRR
jgi:glutathione synthase